MFYIPEEISKLLIKLTKYSKRKMSICLKIYHQTYSSSVPVAITKILHRKRKYVTALRTYKKKSKTSRKRKRLSRGKTNLRLRIKIGYRVPDFLCFKSENIATHTIGCASAHRRGNISFLSMVRRGAPYNPQQRNTV